MTITVYGSSEEKHILYGLEPHGGIHIGHYICLRQLKKSALAGKKVTILLADTHSVLNKKAQTETALQSLESFFKIFCPLFNVVRGSTINFTPAYMRLFLNLSQKITVRRLKKGTPLDMRGDFESLTFGKLCYIVMQITDSAILDADTIYFGLDQLKIYMRQREVYAKAHLPVPKMCALDLLNLDGIKISKSTHKFEFDGSLFNNSQKLKLATELLANHTGVTFSQMAHELQPYALQLSEFYFK